MQFNAVYVYGCFVEYVVGKYEAPNESNKRALDVVCWLSWCVLRFFFAFLIEIINVYYSWF